MKIPLALAAMLAGVSFVSCAGPQQARVEAHRLVEAGTLLVDVRSPEEFAAGHLPGAVNIPVETLSGRLGELGPPEKPVAVYCRTGKRSGRAEQILKEQGYPQVINLGAQQVP
ncbi:rhodanese-like domain-containing protein [Myxococcaceae bacterium GXIMD 01537]